MKRADFTGGKAILALALLPVVALTGCEDPKPGLQDEARVEKVVDCKAALRRFAPAGPKRDKLCECVTAKLANQRLTLDDLTGPKRDRAMEQLHWCGVQVGVFGKDAPKSVPSASDEVAETPEEGTETADAPSGDGVEAAATPAAP